VFKEGIGHHLYLMKEEILLKRGEAEWEGVADKVDVMAPLAELDAQFRRDGAASAIGGIAGDADLHRKSKVRCPLSNVKGAMSEVAKGEEGVPAEAGDIWLASGRGPAARAKRRRGWPALAKYNASTCVTLPLRIKSSENMAPPR